MNSLKFPTRNTPILCQGITSEMGSAHTELALAYGSHIVAGTSRDKNINLYQDIPVFRTVQEAVRKTKPCVSVIFSSPARALGDVEEAVRARIPLVICTVEHVPLHDALRMVSLACKYGVTLIGPSSPGIVRVGDCLAGNIPAHLFPKGNIGMIGRSSSLIYEAVQQLAEQNMGVSTCVALGAAPIVGTSFVPIWEAMLSDKQTKAVLVIGQLSGDLEMELAIVYKRSRRKKPLIVYIPGQTIPPLSRTPLLGTKTLNPADIIANKKDALVSAGAIWVESPSEMGQTVAKIMRSLEKKD